MIAILPAIGSGGVALERFDVPFLLGFFAVFAGLFLVFERVGLRRAVRSLVAQELPDRGRVGVHLLRASEDGLTESTAVGETFTRWSAVHAVEEDDRYLYIYTAPGAAHVVPKRSVEADIGDRFIRLVRERRLRAAG